LRLNPEKCTFGFKAGKFLGLYLAERGIAANLDKCEAIIIKYGDTIQQGARYEAQ
jgi:hypothetical protein